MKSGEKTYIWQQQDWPHWRYAIPRLMGLLGQVHRAQGNLLGRMQTLGLGLREQATLQVLTEDVVKTSEIEGEHLNPDAVRSSIARRLGVDIGALAPADRHVDGVVDMVLDTTTHHHLALTPLPNRSGFFVSPYMAHTWRKRLPCATKDALWFRASKSALN
jgi:Fic family protein